MATLINQLSIPFVSLDPARRAASRDIESDTAPWLWETELGYMVHRYDDVAAILRDRRWHNPAVPVDPQRDANLYEWLSGRQPTLLAMNGEDHKRLRRVIAPWLTPQNVDRFRPTMRDRFRGLLATAVDRVPCQFVSEVCEPYATHVIFDLVGTSADWRERFRALSNERAEREITMASPTAEIIQISTAFDELIAELLNDHGPAPSGSLLELIRRAESDGAVSRPEAIMLVQNVIGGAADSTQAQLGSAVALFARFDDEYRLLREQPTLAAQAVEEVLRFQGAARGAVRVASEDIEYRDVVFPRATALNLAVVFANRDALAYRAPGRFDIARTEPAPHLSFGHGAHFCVGAALARAQLVEAIQILVEQVASIEIVGETTWLPQTVDFWGPASLPLRLHRSQ